jgi:hypothetical protein
MRGVPLSESVRQLAGKFNLNFHIKKKDYPATMEQIMFYMARFAKAGTPGMTYSPISMPVSAFHFVNEHFRPVSLEAWFREVGQTFGKPLSEEAKAFVEAAPLDTMLAEMDIAQFYKEQHLLWDEFLLKSHYRGLLMDPPDYAK